MGCSEGLKQGQGGRRCGLVSPLVDAIDEEKNVAPFERGLGSQRQRWFAILFEPCGDRRGYGSSRADYAVCDLSRPEGKRQEQWHMAGPSPFERGETGIVRKQVEGNEAQKGRLSRPGRAENNRAVTLAQTVFERNPC